MTLNAKYVHVALSLRYLRNAARRAGFRNVWLREFTIQAPLWKMAAELSVLRPEVLGFSIYIWNREQTLALIELVKKQQPSITVVIGGPEVSFEHGSPSPYVDEVIAGEGELKWVELLQIRAAGGYPDAATRARWAEYGTQLPALEQLPYLEEDYADLEHRLVYLETSRGCPFTCSFCLSALDKQVRFFPEEPVRGAVRELIERGARRIKFLDRTFNLGRGRVLRLFRWLAGFPAVQFHFEVVGDLLNEELLAFLDQAPRGMFQFEVGIQTADPEVHTRIERKQNMEKLFAAIRRLREAGRVHLHADLIWGLPGETQESIRASFETVLALRPHELQLGFLKFLPGAPIRRLIGEHGYVFQDRPPYELISHHELSAEAVLELKRFTEVFDLYYNSQKFQFTLGRLSAAVAPWELFGRLADHFRDHGLLLPAHGLESLTEILLAVAEEWLPRSELLDLLKLDYVINHRARRVPAFLKGDPLRMAPALRARRKARPEEILVPFAHRVELFDGRAELTPANGPIWYAISYADAGEGYMFHPQFEAVD